jgi:hypothetical protein
MTVRENLALPLEMRRLRTIERLPLLGRQLPAARRTRRQIDADVSALAAARTCSSVDRHSCPAVSASAPPSAAPWFASRRCF